MSSEENKYPTRIGCKKNRDKSENSKDELEIHFNDDENKKLKKEIDAFFNDLK